jgi:hypothetical protein
MWKRRKGNMSIETISQILGLVGDVITFSGGLVLAIKEAGEEKRARERVGVANALENFPNLKKLTILIDETLIRNESDIEVAIASRASQRARWGGGLIAAGFVFLFVARVLEICSKH